MLEVPPPPGRPPAAHRKSKKIRPNWQNVALRDHRTLRRARSSEVRVFWGGGECGASRGFFLGRELCVCAREIGFLSTPPSLSLLSCSAVPAPVPACLPPFDRARSPRTKWPRLLLPTQRCRPQRPLLPSCARASPLLPCAATRLRPRQRCSPSPRRLFFPF